MGEKYLIFIVQGRQYALPSRLISEVTVLEKVFPLPLVPDYVWGIINRYSVPYALIDINFMLLKAVSKARKIIVLKEDVDKLAFLIDDVTDIADLPAEKLMKIEQGEAEAGGLLSAYFEWKGSNVFCLDSGEIIRRIRQDFGQQDA